MKKIFNYLILCLLFLECNVYSSILTPNVVAPVVTSSATPTVNTNPNSQSLPIQPAQSLAFPVNSANVSSPAAQPKASISNSLKSSSSKRSGSFTNLLRSNSNSSASGTSNRQTSKGSADSSHNSQPVSNTRQVEKTTSQSGQGRVRSSQNSTPVASYVSLSTPPVNLVSSPVVSPSILMSTPAISSSSSINSNVAPTVSSDSSSINSNVAPTVSSDSSSLSNISSSNNQLSSLQQSVQVQAPLDSVVKTFSSYFLDKKTYPYSGQLDNDGKNGNGNRDNEGKNDQMTGHDQLIRALRSPIDYDMFLGGKNQWDAYCNDNLNSKILGGINPKGNKNIFDFSNIKDNLIAANLDDVVVISDIIRKVLSDTQSVAIGSSKHHSGKSYWREVVARKQTVVDSVIKFRTEFLKIVHENLLKSLYNNSFKDFILCLRAGVMVCYKKSDGMDNSYIELIGINASSDKKINDILVLVQSFANKKSLIDSIKSYATSRLRDAIERHDKDRFENHLCAGAEVFDSMDDEKILQLITDIQKNSNYKSDLSKAENIGYIDGVIEAIAKGIVKINPVLTTTYNANAHIRKRKNDGARSVFQSKEKADAQLIKTVSFNQYAVEYFGEDFETPEVLLAVLYAVDWDCKTVIENASDCDKPVFQELHDYATKQIVDNAAKAVSAAPIATATAGATTMGS